MGPKIKEDNMVGCIAFWFKEERKEMPNKITLIKAASSTKQTLTLINVVQQ